MTTKVRFYSSLLLLPLVAGCASPKLSGVGAAMQAAVDAREISGAVTVVVTKNKVIHLECTGLADMAAKKPMQPDALFCIASMTKPITTVQTGDLPTGFFQSAQYGRYGGNYGWGIGTCILRAPHPGVAAMLSPGTFGHGGAWGTQAWMDPVRGVAYILMVQRSNFGNSDATSVRRAFQQAAVEALAQKALTPAAQ